MKNLKIIKTPVFRFFTKKKDFFGFNNRLLAMVISIDNRQDDWMNNSRYPPRNEIIFYTDGSLTLMDGKVWPAIYNQTLHESNSFPLGSLVSVFQQATYMRSQFIGNVM